MILTAISLIDRFIQMLTVREANRVKEYNVWLEPMYKDAEAVANDYLNLCQQIRNKIKSNVSPAELVLWLEERRYQNIAVRMKMRALLENYHERNPDLFEYGLSTFEKGVLGLLKGGLNLISEGRVTCNEDFRLAYFGKPPTGSHTVLDLLYRFSDENINENRKELLYAAELQLDAIKYSWEQVVKGYLEMKEKLT